MLQDIGPPPPSATLSFVIYYAFPHNSPTIFLSQRFACFAGQIIGFILGFILYSQYVSSPHSPPPRRRCTVPAAQHAQRNTHNHALSSFRDYTYAITHHPMLCYVFSAAASRSARRYWESFSLGYFGVQHSIIRPGVCLTGV